MLENPTNEYSSQIKLVEEIENPILIAELQTFANQTVIWSLVEEHNPGKIYELFKGKAVTIVENDVNPFISIAGELDETAFIDAIKLCLEDSLIYCSPTYHKWFLEKNWQPLFRVKLKYNNFLSANWQERLQIKPIDNSEIFKQCYQFEKVSKKFGNAENFLKFGQGYALCNNEQIMAEVYSDHFGKEYIPKLQKSWGCYYNRLLLRSKMFKEQQNTYLELPYQ